LDYRGHLDTGPGQPGIRLCGRVVHGDKRGRKLGFPTANIALAPGATLPPDAVYSCFVTIGGHQHPLGATASVGNNPTFDDVLERRVEIYIHDFNEIIYGCELDISFVGKLRDMRRFSGIDDLIEQTARDVAQSRLLLAPHLLGERAL
jgi:riboflavin kinase/FMN adenylyltransferase